MLTNTPWYVSYNFGSFAAFRRNSNLTSVSPAFNLLAGTLLVWLFNNGIGWERSSNDNYFPDKRSQSSTFTELENASNNPTFLLLINKLTVPSAVMLIPSCFVSPLQFIWMTPDRISYKMSMVSSSLVWTCRFYFLYPFIVDFVRSIQLNINSNWHCYWYLQDTIDYRYVEKQRQTWQWHLVHYTKHTTNTNTKR